MHENPLGTARSATTTLDLESCMACGHLTEVTGCFQLPGLDGPERYLRTRCMLGHTFVGPEFALRAESRAS
ncbi:hypothetical protein [Euzebya sp.]|uniref:hypothetical protein n=1 Tax=Euzebya sp. TaxID=1971409 RepID=UPI003511CDF8